jgi:hypothetical protein
MMLDVGADDNVSLAPKALSVSRAEKVARDTRHTNAKGEVIADLLI